MKPGEVVELDVEIWPTCIVVPKGYRLVLTVRGRDYVYAGEAATLSNMKNPMRGCGPFEHDDPNRPLVSTAAKYAPFRRPEILAVAAGDSPEMTTPMPDQHKL